MNLVAKWRDDKSLKPRVLWCAALVIIFTIGLFVYSWPAGRHHAVEVSLSDYDYFYVYNSLVNYERDGYGKYWGIANRKGSLRLLYFPHKVGTGCSVIDPQAPSPQLYNFDGEMVAARGASSDCIYIHFPPFSELFWYLAWQMGVPFDFNSTAFLSVVTLIGALTSVFGYLLLLRLTASPGIAALAMILLMLCKGYFVGLYDVVQRPFENLFLLICFFLFAHSRINLFLLFVFLCALSSYDYALALPILSLAYFRLRLSKSWPHTLLKGLAPIALAHSLLLNQKALAVGGLSSLWQDTQMTLAHRFGEGDYWHHVKFFLQDYLEIVNSAFPALPFWPFVLVVIWFGRPWLLREKLSFLALSGFLIFCSICIGLALPVSGAEHNFVKFRSALLWMAPLLALYLQVLKTGWQEGRRIVALGLLGAGIALACLNDFAVLRGLDEWVRFHRTPSARHTDLTFIEDISVAAPGRVLRWEEHSARKSLLSAHVPLTTVADPLPFWSFPATEITIQGTMALQIKAKPGFRLEKMIFLFEGSPDSFDCHFHLQAPPLFTRIDVKPSAEKFLRDTGKEFRFENFPAEGYLSALCQTPKARLRRLWINGESSL